MEVPSFTSPGFPIYRALIVPRHEDGEMKEIIEVDDKIIRTWEQVLQGLRNYISQYHRIIERLKKQPSRHEYLETLADIIALYFRQPLQLDPIPSLVFPPLRIYAAIRKIQTVMDIFSENPLSIINFVTNLPKEKGIDFIKTMTEIPADVFDKLVDSWLCLPADTRPGYNTSGLIPHLLVTSAIAWALAVEEGLDREGTAKARLAALLHDMSKPFNYRRHWEITDKVVDLVFDRNVLGPELVDELKQVVRKHHTRSGDIIGKIIHEADVSAASVDRLSKLTEKILQNELGDKYSVLYGSGEEAWEEWAKLENTRPGKIRELTQKFLGSLKNLNIDGEIGRGSRENEDGKLLYFLVDLGGIQEFIFRTVDLRTVTASSYLIDFIASVYVLMGLQHYLSKDENVWIPVEAFMINGGGNLSFIAPRTLEDSLNKHLEKIKNNLRSFLGIRLYYGNTVLTDSFARTASSAALATNLQKIKRDEAPSLKFVPLPLCKYCNTNTVEIPEENICRLCSDLHKIGTQIHFKEKWVSGFTLLPKHLEIGPPNTPLDPEKDIMYIISGHTVDEYDKVQRGDIKKRNVAVVKFDANMMGVFFAGSVSLTDALERSWRVDMSLKMAYQEALCEMYEAVSKVAGKEQAELAVRQCYLGTLYIGGDDGLIICPSWASIPLALGISKYFNEGVGGVLTLSIGLVATPPEHDIWSSIEAVSALLTKAKKCGRRISGQTEGFAALCFDVIEGGILSGSIVGSRYAELKREGLTVQPFIIGGKASPSDTGTTLTTSKLDPLLNYVFEKRPDDLVGLYTSCWMASRERFNGELENEVKTLLKTIRSVLKETPEIVKTSNELALKVSFTYWNRQLEREGQEKHKLKAYKIVLNAVREYLLRNEKDLQTPIADIDRLIKIVGGGVI